MASSSRMSILIVCLLTFIQQAEYKSDQIPEQSQKKPPPLQPAMPIRRPTQPGAKRGGRGGLGFKRGGIALSGSRAQAGVAGGGEDAANGTAGDSEEGTKSNADFKAMFLKR